MSQQDHLYLPALLRAASLFFGHRECRWAVLALASTSGSHLTKNTMGGLGMQPSQTGECVACGATFDFNPDLVPSERVSHGPDGRRPPDPNGKREPLCRGCAEQANRQRAENGLPLVPILPGAYSPQEVC
jgi:hypothetical protein